MKTLLLCSMLFLPAAAFAYGPYGSNSGGIARSSNVTLEDLTVNGDTVIGSNGTDTLDINVTSAAVDATYGLNIGTTTNGSGTSILFLDGANRRVGVNTTSPADNLQIGSSATGATTMSLDGGTSSNIVLQFRDAGTIRTSLTQSNGGNGDFLMQLADGTDFVLNNSQVNSDFAIYADANANFFYLDANAGGGEGGLNIGGPAAGTASAMLDITDNQGSTTTVRISSFNGTDMWQFHADGSFVSGSLVSQGSGTINAEGVFDNGSGPLTDYVFDMAFDGVIDWSKYWRASEDLKQRFRMYSIDEMGAFIEEKRHMPDMPSQEEWNRDGTASLGRLVHGLWETVERQQLYIQELHVRLKELEARP